MQKKRLHAHTLQCDANNRPAQHAHSKHASTNLQRGRALWTRVWPVPIMNLQMESSMKTTQEDQDAIITHTCTRREHSWHTQKKTSGRSYQSQYTHVKKQGKLSTLHPNTQQKGKVYDARIQLASLWLYTYHPHVPVQVTLVKVSIRA